MTRATVQFWTYQKFWLISELWDACARAFALDDEKPRLYYTRGTTIIYFVISRNIVEP